MEYFKKDYRISFSIKKSADKYEIMDLDYEKNLLFLEHTKTRQKHILNYKDNTITNFEHEINKIYIYDKYHYSPKNTVKSLNIPWVHKNTTK